MPPKPKADGKAGKVKKEPAPVDEYDTMTIEQLQEEHKKKSLRLSEIRRSRNYYQLEKDQVQQFYEIVREEVDKTRSHIRNVEAQLERLQTTHASDLQVYMQRVVHLEYEHAANIEACHAAGEKTLLKDSQDHKSRMLALTQTRLELVAALEREEEQRAEEIRTMRDTERKEAAKLRDKFERQHQTLKTQYESRLECLQQELDVRRRLEIHEAGERHNTHLNTLIWNHEAKVEETRAYYISITKDHVALITELQQRVAQLHAHQKEGRESLAQLEQQQQAVSVPVRESAAQVAVLSAHEAHMSRCSQSLVVLQGTVSSLNAKIQTLRSSRARLAIEHQAIGAERERLREAWAGIVDQAESGAGARADQLEKTLSQLQEAYRGENARLGAALRAGALDAGVARRVAAKLDSVLGAKQEQVEQLRYEVARAGKMHDDWQRLMRAKLISMDIPEDDLGPQELLGCANTAPTGILTK